MLFMIGLALHGSENPLVCCAIRKKPPEIKNRLPPFKSPAAVAARGDPLEPSYLLHTQDAGGFRPVRNFSKKNLFAGLFVSVWTLGAGLQPCRSPAAGDSIFPVFCIFPI